MMKSYWGITHLDYPNDPDGYVNALGYREIWPLIGLVGPTLAMLFTRGLDITWRQGDEPPIWYVLILVFSGALFPFVYSFRSCLIDKLNRALKIEGNNEARAELQQIYRADSIEIWNLYYFIKYISDITLFLKLTTMGWGISSIIFFAIGRV